MVDSSTKKEKSMRLTQLVVAIMDSMRANILWIVSIIFRQIKVYFMKLSKVVKSQGKTMIQN